MKKIFLGSLILLFSIKIIAQKAGNPQPKWAIVTQIGHQDQGFAINVGALQTIQKVPIRPNISFGIERTWKQGSWYRFYQDAQLGYYHNTYEEKVYGLTSNAGFEFKLFKGLHIAPRIGVGYNYAKPSDIRYKLEGDKWVKAENNDPSVSRLNVSGGLNLGYRFNDCFDIGVNGHYALVLPHIPEVESPFFLYRGFGLTGRYYF